MTVVAVDHARLPGHDGTDGAGAGAGAWTLLQLLSNHLILSHTAPYLPVSALLSLGATSRSFRELVYHTPNVFRHLDLTQVRTAQQLDIGSLGRAGEIWRDVQVDDNLTEDDFYSAPLRLVFSALRRGHILSDVSTLILDGLSVTAGLVHVILTDPSFSVRILSLREVKNLNERELRGALQTACRPGRPDGTPRLRGLYLFGASEPAPAVLRGHAGVSQGSGTIGAGWNHRSQEALTSSLGKEGDDPWYVRRGKMVPRPIPQEWASTLLACAGVICFDAVLCQGPRHLNSPVFGKVRVPRSSAESASGAPSQWAVATHALGGCAGCGSAPEGWTVWGEARDRGAELSRFPLLAPPPLHSSNIRVACCPSGSSLSPRLAMALGGSKGARQACPAGFIPRCIECLRDRYCWGCHAWWCETCFAARVPDAGQAEEPSYKARVVRSCWECGPNCHDCVERSQLTCGSCCGGYCIIHNEGSTLTKCDWCSARGRRTRAHPIRYIPA